MGDVGPGDVHDRPVSCSSSDELMTNPMTDLQLVSQTLRRGRDVFLLGGEELE